MQNSVFEGELTDARLGRLKSGLSGLVDTGDSVLIYRMRTDDAFCKEVIGNERLSTDNIQ